MCALNKLFSFVGNEMKLKQLISIPELRYSSELKGFLTTDDSYQNTLEKRNSLEENKKPVLMSKSIDKVSQPMFFSPSFAKPFI